MPRVTLGDAKDPTQCRIAQSIGACPTDDRFLAILNEGIQRLITKGHWWGTVARYKFCANDGCITLPRQVATIEAVAVCGHPVQVRDFWYEFLENGYGTRNPPNPAGTVSAGCCGQGGCGFNEAIMRGRFPTFADLKGVNKQLRFVCDLPTDVGKQVLALGYDENKNWIRTLQGGVYKDGELISLAQSPGTNSTKLFTVLTDLQFPSNRDGQVWLYEYNTSDATQRLIGKYEYDETRPSYARYYFPGIRPTVTNGACTQTFVELIGKLDFVPVKNDTDYLSIANLPALKEICMAINSAEHEPDATKKAAIITAGLVSAVRELDSEADHFLGSGRKMGMNIIGSSVGSLDPVQNFI